MPNNKERALAVIGLAGILGLTLWAYWGCLGNPFHFDDVLFLENPLVTDPGDPLALLLPTQIRQLTYLSFLVNYRLAGTRPLAYHAVNLGLHLLNIVGIWFFARLLFKHGFGQDHPLRGWLPFATAGIFALHPIQSEPVNYVYQRSVMWAALFSIAALSIFLYTTRRGSSKLHQLFVGIAFLLAVAGKESALSLPLVFLVYLWCAGQAGQDLIRRTRWLFLLMLAVMLAGAVWTLYLLYHFQERTTGLAMLDLNPFRYLAAETQVIVKYLRMLVWPSGLSVDHAPAIQPFTSPYALGCNSLLLGLIAAGAWSRRRSEEASFLALSFFCFLAPTSSVIPSADFMFEHRLYLPMIAAAPLLALGMTQCAGWLARGHLARRIAIASVLLLTLGVYAAASRERTYIWGDNVRLWTDAASKAPAKARAHYNLGVSFLAVDRSKARAKLLRAQELRPNHAPTLYNLGWLEQSYARYDSARRHYLEALEADPAYWQAHHNLGNVAVLQGRLQDALSEFQVTVQMKSSYWPAYLSLGTLQVQLGQYRAAKDTLMALRSLRPDLLEARYLLGYALIEIKDTAEALEQLRLLESKDHDGVYKERIAQLRQRIAEPSK